MANQYFSDGNTNATDIWLRSDVNGDSYKRFEVQANGAIKLGPGTSPEDIVLTRTNISELSIQNGSNLPAKLIIDSARFQSINTSFHDIDRGGSLPTYSTLGFGNLMFQLTGGSHTYPDDTYSSLFLAMVQGPPGDEGYYPIIATDHGFWAKKDINASGAFMTDSPTDGTGGGAVLIGQGFWQRANFPPCIVLTEQETLHIYTNVASETHGNLELGTNLIFDANYGVFDKIDHADNNFSWRKCGTLADGHINTTACTDIMRLTNDGTLQVNAITKLDGSAFPFTWNGGTVTNGITINSTSGLTITGGGQSSLQSYTGIYANPNSDKVQISLETNGGIEGGIFGHSNGNFYMGSWSNNNLIFRTNNTDRMTLDTFGNLTIRPELGDYGSPTHFSNKKFSVRDNPTNGYAAVGDVMQVVDTSAYGGSGYGQYSNIGGIQFSDGYGECAAIRIHHNAYYSAGVAHLSFWTNSAGYTSTAAERLRITNNGNMILWGGYAQLQATGNSLGSLGTIGNGTGLIVYNNDPLYGILMGVEGSGKGWIQVQRTDNATAYNLRLQPLGGAVEIGGCTLSSDTASTLRIASGYSSVTIGAQNAGCIHFISNGGLPFYFNNDVVANGHLKIYNNGANICDWYGTMYNDNGVGARSAVSGLQTSGDIYTPYSIQVAGGIQFSYGSASVQLVWSNNHVLSLIADSSSPFAYLCNKDPRTGATVPNYTAYFGALDCGGVYCQYVNPIGTTHAVQICSATFNDDYASDPHSLVLGGVLKSQGYTNTSWSCSAPSRAIGTIYTNNTGKSLVVHVTLGFVGVGQPYYTIATVWMDGNQIARASNGINGLFSNFTFVVPDGKTYAVVCNHDTSFCWIDTWREYTL